MSDLVPIRSGTELVADREDVELVTVDGLVLVGALALPHGTPPVATLVCLHPLPTAGGFMDSHVLRKAAARLPALAGIAVLRFNTRGTGSPRGRSEGEYDGGVAERYDVAAAMSFVAERGLPAPWLLGWSFGTELALKYGLQHPIEGAILLSPPLHSTTERELAAWHGSGRPLVVLVPELDDFLRPEEAARRFAVVPEARLVPVPGAKHLWVGENQVRRVLDEIVGVVAPGRAHLPAEVPRELVAVP
ncbi:MAG TPA: alpha/beta hydrolase [Amnibacterium sp.]|nr:alpha/beta hydrolase [Amnibacterium sp.]